jgi:hypothetical protein
MSTIDISILRKMYWSDVLTSPESCPECASSLIKQRQTFLLYTKQKNKEEESFMTGNEAGSFCPNCPTIVLDKQEFNTIVGAISGSTSTMYLVAGIVNLAAVPEDKADIPLGDEDNPIPLVEFSSYGGGNTHQEPIRSNKIGRNEPCPCGSGKKYKKCCYGKLT